MLPVLAERHSDELFASLVSRTARANGIPGLQDLVLDFSVNPRDFHLGKVNAIESVAEVVAINAKDALHSSFRKVGEERYTISGQVFADRHLIRSLYRVCPACIRQDIGPELTSKTFTRPYARIVWAVAAAHCCPVHRLLLVRPPEHGPPHEFHQTWEPWLLEIFDGDFDSQTASEGSFEAFASAKLSNQDISSGGHVAKLPVEIVGAAAEVLGFSVLHGAKWLRKEMTPQDKALAVDAGFKALQGGEAGVCAVLDGLRLAAGQPQDKPAGRYGTLYEWLLRGGGSGPEFSFLQSHLERHVEENWPLGPNDVGFKIEQRTRRFHSILTASAQYGLRPPQVGSLLDGARLKGDLALPTFEQIYDAVAVEQILEQVSSSISMLAAMELLGLTRTQMATLIEGGLLTVSRGGDRNRPRFSEADIRRFQGQYADIPVKPDLPFEPDEVEIAKVARRHAVSTAVVFQMIVDRRLTRLRRAEDNLLWSNIRVSSQEVDRLLSAQVGEEARWLRLSTAASRLAMSPDFMRELAASGWFDLRVEIEPRTRQSMTSIAEAGIIEFEARFITKRLLARKVLSNVRRAQRRLQDAQIAPIVSSRNGIEAVLNIDSCQPVFAEYQQLWLPEY